MEIEIKNGFLLINGEMINLNSICKIIKCCYAGNDNCTKIIYNNYIIPDRFNVPYKEVQKAILNNERYKKAYGVVDC